MTLFRQENTWFGSVLIWALLCVAIVFPPIWSAWSASNPPHTVFVERKAPTGLVLLVFGPVLTQDVIVDNFPEKKEDVAGVGRMGSFEVVFDYFHWIHADESVSFGASNVKEIIGSKERVIWKKKGSVIWRNRQLICIRLGGQSAPAGYQLCRSSALVGYAEEKVSRPELVVFFGGHYEPRTFGIKDSLSIQASGIGRNSSVFRLHSDISQGLDGDAGSYSANYRQGESTNRHDHIGDSGPPIGFGFVFIYSFVSFFGGWGLEWYVLLGFRGHRYWRVGLFILAVCIMASGFACLFLYGFLCDQCNGASENCQRHKTEVDSLHGNTVPRKYPLTSVNYRGTVIAIGRTNMANVLDSKKQVAIISALAEGSGIRQIERMTGVHRDTIMRLGVRTGKGCARLLDRKMRGLTCRQLQFDEIWGFIGKKERHLLQDDDPQYGDVWTFCAIDRDTKLVPSFKVGKRDLATADAFVSDVASRVTNRVQISADALRAYIDAIEMSFGADVDFAQIVKTYITDDSHVPERRFSAPEIVVTEKKSISGFPDLSLASTSHVERLNGTTRLHMRRLTRLTYAFSKKLENFEAAVGLHFAYYNFVKRHSKLRATPAMAAGIERDFWTVENLLEAAA